jgi:hypothetical protein
VPIRVRSLNGQKERSRAILQLTGVQAQVYDGLLRIGPGYDLTAELGRKGAESVHPVRFGFSLVKDRKNGPSADW